MNTSINKILNEINDYQHHNYMKIKQIKNIIKWCQHIILHIDHFYINMDGFRV